MSLDLPIAGVRPEALDERHALKFRVVSIDGKRRAFRLEAIFWFALESIARQRRRSVSAQIATILRGVSDEANASAAVRASVAADLVDLYEIDRAEEVSPSWEKVLQAMPHPAFALARNHAVMAVNEPMWAFLESRGLLRGAGDPDETLSVELSAGALARPREVAPGDVILSNAMFRSGGRTANCRVRIVQAVGDGDDRRLMLGFPEAM